MQPDLGGTTRRLSAVTMSSADIQARIGPALVDYSGNGIFPSEESVAAANIEDAALPGALRVLNNAKIELEVCSLNVYSPHPTCHKFPC